MKTGLWLAAALSLFATANAQTLEGQRRTEFKPLFSTETESSCQIPVRERATSGIQASFDYSMPARYGHDRKFYPSNVIDPNSPKAGNGIIDLPNKLSYVMNFESWSDDPGDACPCLEDDPEDCRKRSAARFRVNLEAQDLERYALADVGENVCRAKVQKAPSYRWERVVRGERQVIGTGPRANVCLPEGSHDITLRVFADGAEDAVTRPIAVVDHLIVNLGDSYAAGEGVPEKTHRPEYMINTETRTLERVNWSRNVLREHPFHGQWADPGIEIPIVRTPLEAYSEVNYLASATETATVMGVKRSISAQMFESSKRTYEGGAYMPDWNVLKNSVNGTHGMFWEHQTAHRSAYTHSSQLALYLERRDPKSSVTYVNLAQSGATIEEGLLGRYPGGVAIADFGDLSNRMTDFIPRRGGQLGHLPQMNQFESLVGSRSADHVYLSVGGNDVGFANAITVLLPGWTSDVNKNRPREDYGGAGYNAHKAIGNGNWKNGGFGLADDHIPKVQLAGLDGLYDDYEDLNERFDMLKRAGMIDGPITLIEVPYFGSVYDSRAKNWRKGEIARPEDDFRIPRSNNTRYCRIRPKGSPIESAFLEMHPREFQFADTEMWRPLVEEMRRTKDFGWRVIEQGPTPAENGMCGTAPYDHNAYEPDHISVLMYEPVERGTRWYRRPDDGATIQLGNEISNKGMFHPNELGYAHVARLLLADLDEADGIEPDGLGRKLNPDLDPDQDDAISEAQLAQRGAPLQQFQLSSEHDVAMRRFAVEACEAVTVTGLSSRRAEISVTVFKSNGEVVVSSQAGRQATPDLPPLDLSGITGRRAQSETRTLERSPLTDSLSNKTISKLTAPADSSCSAEAFAEVDRPRFESATGASVQFVPERQALYYVAVSHRDNDSFDPITGRGDLRLEAPRAAVDVGLMVRQ